MYVAQHCFCGNWIFQEYRSFLEIQKPAPIRPHSRHHVTQNTNFSYATDYPCDYVAQIRQLDSDDTSSPTCSSTTCRPVQDDPCGDMECTCVHDALRHQSSFDNDDDYLLRQDQVVWNQQRIIEIPEVRRFDRATSITEAPDDGTLEETPEPGDMDEEEADDVLSDGDEDGCGSSTEGELTYREASMIPQWQHETSSHEMSHETESTTDSTQVRFVCCFWVELCLSGSVYAG